jgi:signal transduction histidine kinase
MASKNQTLEVEKMTKLILERDFALKKLAQEAKLQKEELEKTLKVLFRKDFALNEIREKRDQILKQIKEKTEELETVRSALINMLEDAEEARKKAEEEKEKTLVIITNLTDGLLVFSKNNFLSLINPQAEIYLDVRKEEVTGLFLKDLYNFPRFRPILDLLGEKLKTFYRKEVKIAEDLILEVSSILLFGAKKEKAGSLVILHDITREKMIEQMKTEFVSIAAHQLRTPLSAMKWSLEFLKDPKISFEEKQTTLEQLYGSTERMIKLVNDLLNVSRIEEGRFVYQFKEEDIIELIKDVVEQVRPNAQKKAIKLIVKFPYVKIPLVKIDREKLSMALNNLLSNAINYSFPKGRIWVNVEEKEKEVLISVKDEGAGIPKHQQARVFTKFFRGTNVIKMETEGSGLGLYITKSIIEAHKGRIWFESEEGKGTTFYFTLPLER